MGLCWNAAALKADGEVWTWGRNLSGGLGDNTRIDKASPVLVVGNHSFIKVAGMYYSTMALKANGELWAWGYNSDGQLGTNDVVSYSSPVLVVGNHSFIDLCCSYDTPFGIKANGEVWSWGDNAMGMVGDNTTTDRSSPVLVVGNHSFLIAKAGGSASFGIKANGEAWAWGNNSNGQLGVNEWTTSYSSPILVVGNHNFMDIDGAQADAVALKENGEAWAWGVNLYGELGNNTATGENSPVKVIGEHSFRRVRAGQAYWSGAIKEDGTIWTWGDSIDGQLGDNTTTDKSSPVSVVGNHSFVSIIEGYTYGAALKANGEVWCWGANTYGQLGDNTSANSKSSPVLVVGNHSFVALDERILLEDLQIGFADTEGAGSNVCWGHDTDVEEDYIRDIQNNWTGTGTINYSGDAEEIVLDTGEEMISEAWYTGARNILVEVNKYQSGDTPTIYYRTAATEGGV